MSKINKQSYLAELAKLLGFMSSWDRQAVLDKYNALFEEAGDEAALIKMLGSPTHLAISLANSYVPSAAPAVLPAEEKPASPFEEFEEKSPEEAPEAQQEQEAPQESEAPLPETVEEPAAPGRRLRPFGLIVSVLYGLVIGVPVALLLICLGIPFLALGIVLVAADVFAVLQLVAALTMISDVLVVIGVGAAAAAVGLFLAWFGLWLSLALGKVWIGGAILGLCRRMSYKKEVAE